MRRRRSDAVYASKAEKQRAYRRRKAKQRSDRYITALGLDPERHRMSAVGYGKFGNIVKKKMAEERRAEERRGDELDDGRYRVAWHPLADSPPGSD